MRTRTVGMILSALTFGLLATGALADDDEQAVKKELAALNGEWKMTSRVEEGDETPLETIKNRVITFEEGAYTLRDGEEIIVEVTFKLNPSKDPKWFDLTITSANNRFKGRTELGIYKIDGDTFTLCIADFDAERPTDFTAKSGSGRILATYKKQNK